MTISILSLHTYPVKSCGSVTHTQVAVSTAGLAYDRHWVIVDDQGIFLTQRTYPSMALVQPTLDETALFLNAPEMPTLRVSLRKSEPHPPATPIRIWQSDTLGLDEGDTAAHWFSDYLGRACRLYRVHHEALRLASPQRIEAWRQRHPGHEAFPQKHAFGFADAFPFLIVNQGSLDDLNTRLEMGGQMRVGMGRFRPNIVIQGLDAYEEDYLCSLHVGELTFAIVKGCARCPVPNIDPATAQVGIEPMKTLGDYRRFDTGVMFGINAVVAGTGRGTVLSVGDRIVPVLDI